jgi:hypothetical protein
MANINTSSSHYSFATDPPGMKKWCERVALETYKLSKKHTFQPIFYGTGLSGISSIIALSQKLESYKNFPYGFFLIRKPHDNTHSDSGSGEICFKNIDVNVTTLWIFVDDFVESGLTFKNCLEAVQKSAAWKNTKEKKFPASSFSEKLLFINQKTNPILSLLSLSHLSSSGGEYYSNDQAFTVNPLEEQFIQYF